MNNQIKIIYADSKGGVKTVSNILHKSFINNSINCELLNMNDYGKNLWQKLKNSYKTIKTEELKNKFDPEFFIGVSATIKKNDKSNVHQ